MFGRITKGLMGAGLGFFAGYKLGEPFSEPCHASLIQLSEAYREGDTAQKITFVLFLVLLSPIVLQQNTGSFFKYITAAAGATVGGLAGVLLSIDFNAEDQADLSQKLQKKLR